MTTEAELYAPIADNPEDWPARLVLADWYEDRGDYVNAEGQRWQVANKRRPWVDGMHVSWCGSVHGESLSSLCRSELGYKLLCECEETVHIGAERGRYYDTPLEADKALAAALDKLKTKV